MPINRREFLKKSMMAAAGVAVAPLVSESVLSEKILAAVPKAITINYVTDLPPLTRAQKAMFDYLRGANIPE